jgi:small ligand-binding sensory domain FIST
VSRRINIELALEEAIEGARRGQAEDWEPELAIVFLSSAYVQEYGSLVSLLRRKVPSLKYITGSTVSMLTY